MFDWTPTTAIRLVALLMVSPWLGAAMTALLWRWQPQSVLSNVRTNVLLTALLATSLAAAEPGLTGSTTDGAAPTTPPKSTAAPNSAVSPHLRVVWAEWTSPPTPTGTAGWTVELAVSIALNAWNLWPLAWIPWLTCAAVWSLSPRQVEQPGYLSALLVWEGLLLLTFAAGDVLTFCIAAEWSLLLGWWLVSRFGGDQRRTAADSAWRVQAVGQSCWTWGLLGLAIAAVWAQREISAAAATVRLDWVILIDQLSRLTTRYIGSFEYWQMAAGWLTFGLVVGTVFRAGLLPAHHWWPRWLDNAPSAVALLQFGAASCVGAYGFLRFVAPLVAPEEGWTVVLMSLGAATAIVGSFLALAHNSPRRFLAYWWLSLQGIFWIGLSSGEPSVQLAAWRGMTLTAAWGSAWLLILQRLESRQDDAIATSDLPLPRLTAAGLAIGFSSLALLPGMFGASSYWLQRWLILQAIDFWWLAVGSQLLVGWAGVWCLQRIFQGSIRHPDGVPVVPSVVSPTSPASFASSATPHLATTQRAPVVMGGDLSASECLALGCLIVPPWLPWIFASIGSLT